MAMSCLDCGQELSRHNTVRRCRSCNMRHRWAQRTGLTAGKASPSRVRGLSEVEAAWLGALIEGEGHVYHDGRLGFTVVSTEIETIATVLRLVGDGTIHYSNDSNPRHKEQWRWSLRNAASAVVLGDQIASFLTSKQALVRDSIPVWKQVAARCGL